MCQYVCLPVCLSVYLSISPSLFLVAHVNFWISKSAARNCAQRMWLQATGSNTLSVSTIFPSVCPPGRPWVFYIFCIYIDFECGGPALQSIYPHTGFQRTSVGSSQAYVSVSLSVSLSSCPCKVLAIIRAARNCA